MYRIAVTNRNLCEGDFLSRIQKLASGSYYDAILLREKDLAEEKYEKLAVRVLSICERYDKKCILHTFYKTAERLGHPYLHLPLPLFEKMEKEERREFVEIGTSIHSPEQLCQAENVGASYVTAGHIFETDCKKGLPPRGLSFLKKICSSTALPVYGIGGIHAGNEKQVIEQGAAGVCIMSGCMQDSSQGPGGIPV
ncbi:MAG: thiamine phosphate synthase [Lachnospiraceae bacterium]|nr:thiamine phosphate synthase [Lachnospiraceae bacterium]